MQRAGLALARLALAVAPHAQRVQVVCGPGHNGGDGLIAAAHLQRAGKSVDVVLVAPHRALPAQVTGALQIALRVAQDAGVRIGSAGASHGTLRGTSQGASRQAELVIDALFGIGLSRAPDGAARAAIAAMCAGAAPVMAVDVPSGLDADTGAVVGGDVAVRARWTLSLLTLKPGLFTAAGRDAAGDVWFDALGCEADALAAAPAPPCRLVTGTADLWPVRRHAQHKGSFGDVWIVGGACGLRGAAWLAARAASAAGAGRVMVVPADGTAHAELDPLHPELMLRTPQALVSRDTPLESATVVCGCGAGDGAAFRALLPVLIARAGRLLLDADALNVLAADRALADSLARRARRGRPTVMTPHPLEAARWLGTDTAAVQADRVGAARRIAQAAGAHVVLKGSGSVLAAPDGTAWINGSGNPALAGAGTGDVLAGWIGGLWSQGLPVEQALRLGVHTHGSAADRWSERRSAEGRAGAPLEASRLIDVLRERG